MIPQKNNFVRDSDELHRLKSARKQTGLNMTQTIMSNSKRGHGSRIKDQK